MEVGVGVRWVVVLCAAGVWVLLGWNGGGGWDGVVRTGRCDARPKESLSKSRCRSAGTSIHTMLCVIGRRKNGLWTTSVSHWTLKHRIYSVRCRRTESVLQQRSVTVGTTGITIGCCWCCTGSESLLLLLMSNPAATACQGQGRGMNAGACMCECCVYVRASAKAKVKSGEGPCG